MAVGTEAEVRERVGRGGELLSGAAIAPGFQDAHIHAAFAGRILRNVNLDDLHDREAYLARIRAFADASPRRRLDRGRRAGTAPLFADGGPIAAGARRGRARPARAS